MSIAQRLFTRRVFFLSIAPAILIWGLVSKFLLDGIIVRGLGTDMGEAHIGQTIKCDLRLYNSSFYTAYVVLPPTCGCSVHDTRDFLLRPFTSKVVPFEYSVSEPGSGRASRDVVIMYRQRGRVQRIVGKVFFTLKNVNAVKTPTPR